LAGADGTDENPEAPATAFRKRLVGTYLCPVTSSLAAVTRCSPEGKLAAKVVVAALSSRERFTTVNLTRQVRYRESCFFGKTCVESRAPPAGCLMKGTLVPTPKRGQIQYDHDKSK
jgi:hypothetical protein